MKPVTVIGAGLAGSEAAWQLASRGVRVRLFEMRPVRKSPAHHTDMFAELVCSNSLRGDSLENAAGLLKEEMRRLNSLIIKCADQSSVPAGGALAVDRSDFAGLVTNVLSGHPNVEVIRQEISQIDTTNPVIIATGPLTSAAMSETISAITGCEYLYFYDAAAPILTLDSLDRHKVFLASRYDKGEAAYLNCPMNREEYERFYHELINAECAPLKEFEKEIYFEGCMPVEELASRGCRTLLFGPMKPVGLTDPRTGNIPYAVVQLRQDNIEGTLYNIVGFQTHLKWGEQNRVFRMIPGLENAEFVRYGVMHRNTFINSPELLNRTLQFKKDENLFFAGQITGVEGYVESAAMGLVAGINAARVAAGELPVIFPEETAHGALCKYITTPVTKKFQPMNINFGILPQLGEKIRNKQLRYGKISEIALNKLEEFRYVFIH
ncbi:methylenetetrahydrofolate--tRNA-(uracil(54)-C(5))-methyltransferase (FADH(2)-oxidizing) TrmFO [Phosphitispora sp. TUW77]|uniref:methylenetetrahydrofolate--tRNA-(uracil(54)- C(5))-methyltransferase (FADH(2)-oxidizing) TrmFO n=1 Tax=Phosphitispora sp. TUW77 TaxID=3152361 RepID=UPI003AB6A248